MLKFHENDKIKIKDKEPNGQKKQKKFTSLKSERFKT